jgi:hypothetical protein
VETILHVLQPDPTCVAIALIHSETSRGPYRRKTLEQSRSIELKLPLPIVGVRSVVASAERALRGLDELQDEGPPHGLASVATGAGDAIHAARGLIERRVDRVPTPVEQLGGFAPDRLGDRYRERGPIDLKKR